MSASVSLIKRRAASKRAAVNEYQAQHFLRLTNKLREATLQHFGVRSEFGLPEDGWSRFTELPEYEDFVSGAYGCGFVCEDFNPDFPIDDAHRRPAEVLREVSLIKLRHYIHCVIRAERHSDGWGSMIYEAMRAGALNTVCERLAPDSSLYEPY